LFGQQFWDPQKVLEEQKALGTIVGKALGPLARGKGKIPVLVMLQ